MQACYVGVDEKLPELLKKAHAFYQRVLRAYQSPEVCAKVPCLRNGYVGETKNWLKPLNAAGPS
jgi:hypothetical protein